MIAYVRERSARIWNAKGFTRPRPPADVHRLNICCKPSLKNVRFFFLLEAASTGVTISSTTSASGLLTPAVTTASASFFVAHITYLSSQNWGMEETVQREKIIGISDLKHRSVTTFKRLILGWHWRTVPWRRAS
jgi:hypothetical protein